MTGCMHAVPASHCVATGDSPVEGAVQLGRLQAVQMRQAACYLQQWQQSFSRTIPAWKLSLSSALTSHCSLLNQNCPSVMAGHIVMAWPQD